MKPDLLELLMIVCFGISWPLSVIKSWKSRTAKGKSILFELFIWVGYIFGIWRKLLLYVEAQNTNSNLDFLFYLAWFFYALNFLEITVDMILWIRNTILDKKRDSQAAKEIQEKEEEIKRLSDLQKEEEEKKLAEMKKEEVLPPIPELKAEEAVKPPMAEEV